MSKVVNLLEKIIAEPGRISKVALLSENRFKFYFYDLLLEIGHYWSDEYENTIWYFNIYSDTSSKPVSYSTNDLDLEGYQSSFRTVYREVDAKFQNIDFKIDELLSKQKVLKD